MYDRATRHPCLPVRAETASMASCIVKFAAGRCNEKMHSQHCRALDPLLVKVTAIIIIIIIIMKIIILL